MIRSALSLTDFGTFTFYHYGCAITYPCASVCGRSPCSPADYGFYVEQTGGGCTAWRRDFLLNGKPVYMLVTAADDASHELTPFEPIGMGVYSEDGEAFVNWTQAFGADVPPTDVKSEGEMPWDQFIIPPAGGANRTAVPVALVLVDDERVTANVSQPLIAHMIKSGWERHASHVTGPQGQVFPDWQTAIMGCIEVASEV